ncbi:hypothetical protein ROTAS13_03802 [Roseomonas sp. TAS13]|nr:hypothetical protein ROTAS13_03802 [Roseomonas sp. TAS13]
MSRAVVTWRGSGRPEALRKTVLVIPIWRARSVISRAKRASLPSPRNSPTAEAASLADLVTRARIASRTVMVEPGFSQSLEGGREAACRDTGMRVEGETSPDSSTVKSM